MNWQNELEEILQYGCTDSVIEDFVNKHPEINEKDIWDFVYEYGAQECCKGCKFIQRSGLFPCTECSRRVKTNDFYESR